MNKIGLAAMVLVVVLVSAVPVAFAQEGSKAPLTAHYKDARALAYDKYRGIYGLDYAYDYETNTYARISSSPSIIPHDTKTIVLDGKLDENIWTEIESITVNLEPTHPWGGAIKSLSVKAVNNGTWLFMAFEWKDSTESREESPRVKREEGGFFYNQTYFYSDNMYVAWWMKDGQPTVTPWVNAHFAGTTFGKVPWKNEDPSALASLWIYKSYYTDDEARRWPKPYFPALDTFLFGPHKGEEQIIPYPHMIEMYTNTTASYAITYLTHVSGCAFPDKDFFSYEVMANALWANGVYTLEVARPFGPHPLNEPLKATPTFEQAKSYWVYVGASDGHHGENEDVGAISQWFKLYVEPSPTATIPTLFLGIAAVVAGGAVGGVLVVRRRRTARRNNLAAKSSST